MLRKNQWQLPRITLHSFQQKPGTLSSIFIVYMLFCLQSALHAQISMPGPNATWKLEVLDPTANPTCAEYHGYAIYTANTIELDGKTYTLLNVRQEYYYAKNILEDHADFCFVDTINQELGSIGALRSEGSKTYFYALDIDLIQLFAPELPMNTDILLYDFSKNPGDTIHYMNVDGEPAMDSIVSKSTIKLADDIDRIQLITSNSRVYIEGIGSKTTGLLGSVFSDYTEQFNYQKCYKENDLYLIENNTDCENFEQSFFPPEIEEQANFTWPNPFTFYFDYWIPYPSSTIRIYTLDGQLLVEKFSEYHTGVFYTSELAAGAYLITCTSPNGVVAYNVICKTGN